MHSPSWAHISLTTPSRLQILSEFLKQNNFTHSFSDILCLPENFSDVLSNAKNKNNLILIEPSLGLNAIEHLNQMTIQVRQMGCLDLFIKEQNQWWGRCFLAESILHLLAKKNSFIDNTEHALIVGTGCTARQAAFIATRLGFQKIYLSALDESAIQAFAQNLSKVYFDVQFESVSINQLNHLPGTSSLVFNCADHDSLHEVLRDLSYLNFLKTGGTIIDLTFVLEQNALMKSGIEAGANVIKSSEVMAAYDSLWLKHFFNLKIDERSYLDQIQNATLKK